MNAGADVIVVGAGIVGAACAMRLAEAGLRVRVLEAGCPAGGATGAGMGHICVIDDSAAQFALTRESQREWAEIAPELPRGAEYARCGTIWLAADDEELAEADRKLARHAELGVPAERVSRERLRELEPGVRGDLAGALLVPDDAVVYAPVATAWMLAQAAERGAVIDTGRRVIELMPRSVRTADGAVIDAEHVVCAAGLESIALVPGLPLRGRKGHLIITERGGVSCRHQLVELAYIKNAHGHSEESVSFNVQPRRTGQMLIGSSRQYGASTSEVEPRMIRMLIERAVQYMPGLRDLRAIRCWTGFRAASPDSLPIIGPHPTRHGLVLATGHEGLGLTTSLMTARLVAMHIAGCASAIDHRPYLPSRFAELNG
ncbi:MAG: NAD(P)/FAD-dependent oxidoreductase [Phycisphaerales bacterium]